MKDTVIKRMKQEVIGYRQELVSGKLTAEQIVEQSYQLVIKQGLYYAFTNLKEDRLSLEEWNMLGENENITGYLYDLWMHSDADLTEEFAEIICNEVNLAMEVRKN